MADGDLFLMSEEGPMGIASVLFMQIVVGCGDALPENEYCCAAVAEMKRIGEVVLGGGDSEHSSEAKEGVAKPWADFVRAVLDEKVPDSVCKAFFRGASVLPIAGTDLFDFSLSMKAITETAEASGDTIATRFSNVMTRLAGDCHGVFEHA